MSTECNTVIAECHYVDNTILWPHNIIVSTEYNSVASECICNPHLDKITVGVTWLTQNSHFAWQMMRALWNSCLRTPFPVLVHSKTSLTVSRMCRNRKRHFRMYQNQEWMHKALSNPYSVDISIFCVDSIVFWEQKYILLWQNYILWVRFSCESLCGSCFATWRHQRVMWCTSCVMRLATLHSRHKKITLGLCLDLLYPKW